MRPGYGRYPHGPEGTAAPGRAEAGAVGELPGVPWWGGVDGARWPVPAGNRGLVQGVLLLRAAKRARRTQPLGLENQLGVGWPSVRARFPNIATPEPRAVSCPWSRPNPVTASGAAAPGLRRAAWTSPSRSGFRERSDSWPGTSSQSCTSLQMKLVSGGRLERLRRGVAVWGPRARAATAVT